MPDSVDFYDWGWSTDQVYRASDVFYRASDVVYRASDVYRHLRYITDRLSTKLDTLTTKNYRLNSEKTDLKGGETPTTQDLKKITGNSSINKAKQNKKFAISDLEELKGDPLNNAQDHSLRFVGK